MFAQDDFGATDRIVTSQYDVSEKIAEFRDLGTDALTLHNACATVIFCAIFSDRAHPIRVRRFFWGRKRFFRCWQFVCMRVS